MKKNTPGGCCGCGCRTFEYPLNPDLYFPTEVVSFVKERTVTNTRVVVQAMLRTGEEEIEGEVIDDDTDEDDTTVESIDTKAVAGRWEWVYPQAVSVEDSEPEIVGGAESFQRTTTYVDVTVHEERRLFLRFNVSNQYRFGLEDGGGSPYIESSHYLVAIEKYLRAGFPIGPTFGPVPDGLVRYLTTESATAKGFLFDAATPADSDAFDTLFSGLATSHDLTTGPPEGTTLVRDCEAWLPDEATESLALLIDAPEGEDQGVQLDTVKLSINDIEDRSNSSITQEYDWTRDWIREEEGVLVSKRLFPSSDVEIDMESLIVGDWFGNPSHRMRIEMFTESVVDGEVEETVWAEQEFFVEATPPASSEEDFLWFFRSEGTWGDITHAEAETGSGIESPFETISLRLVVREEVVELTGGERGNAFYQMAPYYPDDPPPRFKLRIELDGTQPKFGEISWTQVIHEHYNRNMTCPEAETCPVISPHSHVEWRVKSHSFPNSGATGLPTFYRHRGCGIVANVGVASAGELSVAGSHVNYLTNWVATYSPSADEIWSVSSGHSFSQFPESPEDGYAYYSDWVPGYVNIGGTTRVGPDVDDWTVISHIETRQDFTSSPPDIYEQMLVRTITGIPYDDYATPSLITATEMADAEADYIEELKVETIDKQMYFPGSDDPDEPDFSAGSPFSGHYTIVESNSVSIGDVSGYGIVVAVSEPFQDTEDVEGLPPYTISELTPDYYYFRVTSGTGKSLLFERVQDEFAVVHQEHEPSFETPLEPEDVSAISAVIGSGSYWYEVDGDHYEISGSGQSGPVEESGFVEPVPMAEVQIEYTCTYYQSTNRSSHVADSASYCSDVTVTAEPTVTTNGPPEEDVETPSPSFASYITWGVDFDQGTSTVESHEGNLSLRDWNITVDGDTNRGTLDFTQANPGPTNIWVTSITVGSAKFTHGQPISNPTPPPATVISNTTEIASWVIPGDAFDRTWSQSSVEQQWETMTTEILDTITFGTSSRSVTMRKIVPSWTGTTPPTLTFDGEDDARYSDDEEGKFWRLTSVSVGSPDSPNPSAVLAKLCMSATEADLRDLSITIGPEESAEEP